MKTNENNNSRPFYLKAPKSAMKTLLFTGLILFVIGISAPVLFLFTPFYLVYAFIKIKNFRSKQNELLSSVIYYYLNGDFEKCASDLKAYRELEPSNAKGKIIGALLEHMNENYEGFVKLMGEVPKSIINNDLDLQLKLGESYEKIEQYEKAEEIYKRLLWIFPKSDFIREALNRVEKRVNTITEI